MKLCKIIGEIQNNKLAELEIKGITCDSRKVEEGFLFFCIKGVASDGHKFANVALEKGAAAIVCQDDLGLDNQIIVENSRIAYAEASCNWFDNPSKKMKMIGVTGTNGKTSVTYMLKAILEQTGAKVGLVGTIQHLVGDKVYESKNTTPDAYELQSLISEMYKAGCTHVVMEASSHALHQGRNHGIHYDAAMFTNLTQDHLDYHETMENYAAAKRILFENCDVAVINYDDPAGMGMVEGLDCKVVTYSAKSDNATYSAKNIVIKADGSNFDLVGYDLILRIKMKVGGKFSVKNAMCAAACAMQLGVENEQIVAAINGIAGIKGRAEAMDLGEDFTVIIDYAHTPDGLKNILSTFRDVEKNRLVAVFGCGGDRDRTKRPIMGDVAATYSDFVIVTSDNPRSEDPDAIIADILEGMKTTRTPYKVITNRGDAIRYAVKNAMPGDIIVLAGKGHETYQILKDGTIHFDEREIVREALGKEEK